MTNQDPDLMEVQRGLEAESRAIGQARYRSKRAAPWMDSFGPAADEASLPPGRAMLRRALVPVADAIQAFMASAKSGKAGPRHAAYKLLAPHDADARALAYLTLRCAIQGGVQELRAQSAALMIARAVMDHIQATAFERQNAAGAQGLQRTLAGRAVISRKRQRAIAAIHEAEGVALRWSTKQQLQLGMKLLELATEATGLFDLTLHQTKVGKKIERKQVLEITAKALSWLEKQHERCELLDPLPLPMVVPPRPWTTPTDGGYLQPPIGTRLVRSPSRAYREELESFDIALVYRAVNVVQNTAWRINRRVLEVMDRLVEDGGGMAGLPRQDPEPLPERPDGAEDKPEVIADWKRRRAQVHARNASGKGKRLAITQQLWVARKLVDFPAIYYPHELDWRGRVYVVPQAGPHPQAGDTGRSLLEFATGKSLGETGARWLAIHVANVFGMDKVSFDDRVAWVQANADAILDSARDPLDGSRFWTQAEKPWAALAASFEWAGYTEQGVAFVSHLPIAMDGSNSGLQHLTALLRDAEAAPHVNLVPAEKPGDLYALVAAKTQVIVDASDDPRAEPWKGGKVIRRIVKRPCMTYCFSATAFSMGEQIRAELEQIDAIQQASGLPPYLGGADTYKAANWLGSLLYAQIGKSVPAARQAMQWLRSATKVLNEADLPLWWTTPAGLPVLQRYPNTKATKTEVTFGGQRMQLALEEEAMPRTPADFLDQQGIRYMDARAALNGIAPNFVHSLDAAHLMCTVTAVAGEGITDIAVIHDSFGTHAADTDRLARILRETFVAIYQSDPLAQFHADVLGQIDDSQLRSKVPPLPVKGGLDLKAVRDASYMFA